MIEKVTTTQDSIKVTSGNNYAENSHVSVSSFEKPKESKGTSPNSAETNESNAAREEKEARDKEAEREEKDRSEYRDENNDSASKVTVSSKQTETTGPNVFVVQNSEKQAFINQVEEWTRSDKVTVVSPRGNSSGPRLNGVLTEENVTNGTVFTKKNGAQKTRSEGFYDTYKKSEKEKKTASSARTDKITGLNADARAKKVKNGRVIDVDDGEVTTKTAASGKVSGKVSTKKIAGDAAELKAAASGVKMVTGQAYETEKVTAGNVTDDSKVTTTAHKSTKVKAGKDGGVVDADKKGKTISDLRGSSGNTMVVSDGKNDKKNRGIIAAPFSSNTLPILIVVLAIVAAIALLVNGITLIFGTAVREGYKIAQESIDSYDKGFDRATYLLSKYGLNASSRFSYDLSAAILIGGSEISAVSERNSISTTTGNLLVFSEESVSVYSDATKSLFSTAAGERRGKNKAIFLIGIDDLETRKDDEGAEEFAEKYEELIKESFIKEANFVNSNSAWSKDNLKKETAVYVLSILDTGKNAPAHDVTMTDTVEKYNNALEKVCMKNAGWCFVDVTSLLSEDMREEDGVTLTDDFYIFKLLPYLCTVFDTEYRIGEDVFMEAGDRYGVYGLSTDLSLYDFVEFVCDCKNTDGIYSDFSIFAHGGRGVFSADLTKNWFRTAWESVYSEDTNFVYEEKLYADQQSFIVEEYYRSRLRGYLENTYSINIHNASYAFKAAVISLGYEFGYLTGDDFGNGRESGDLDYIFGSIDWYAAEDSIISLMYDKAKELDPDHSGRWDAEKTDCLALYEGTLDIYELSRNEYGYINWKSHLLEDGSEPVDLILLAPEESKGSGIIVYEKFSYEVDHNEDGGPTAMKYVQYALSFADDPSMYGSGNYKLPYVWGGASLRTGADCSGFVGKILAKYGYLDQETADLHGYSSEDIKKYGTRVKLSDIRIGDVVSYDTNGKGWGHVAIYIGNGQIVHEPSKDRSCGVEIGNLHLAKIVAVNRFDMEETSKYASCDFLGDSRTLSMATGRSLVHTEQEYGYSGDLQDNIHFTSSWYVNEFLPAIDNYIKLIFTGETHVLFKT